MLISLASFAFPLLAFAQTIQNSQGAHDEICNVFNWMFWVLMAVSVIMVMWGAYLYAAAGGSDEQITQAKNTILYAAIGVLAALLARGFPLVVASIFPNGAQGVSGC